MFDISSQLKLKLKGVLDETNLERSLVNDMTLITDIQSVVIIMLLFVFIEKFTA